MKTIVEVLLLCGLAWAGEKPTARVFLTDHESWQQSSSIVATIYTGATKTEQIKTLAKANLRVVPALL